MAGPLNQFKKDYRARFCQGGGTKIDVQPGQNVLELIENCFQSCGSDLTINSPSTSLYCSTPVAGKRRNSTQSQRPEAGLPNSVKRACNAEESLPASPLKPARSRGSSYELPLKPAIPDYVADSNKPQSPVSKRGTNDILADVEALCKSPALSLDAEDDHESLGSPLLLEEAKSPPVYKSHLDDQNSPAAVKSPVEAENLEGPQTGRDEQVVLEQGRECVAASSVQKEKGFSSIVLAALATGTRGERYSASVSPPSPPPVKDQDIEIENEFEFLIDESDDVSWFSIPSKKKKSKKDGSATLVSKAQPSEKEKTESKKGKNRKAQVEAHTKQKKDGLDDRKYDSKGTSESDPVSNSKGKVLKSQRQNSARTGKTKKDALKQSFSNQKKDTSWKPEAEDLMLPPSVLETKASDAEQWKTKVVASEDLPVPSVEHQQEPAVSPKKNLGSSKYLQSESKASRPLVDKKQTAKQKLPKDTAAKKLAESPRKKLKKSVKKSSNKKPPLQREESSDSGEEGAHSGPPEVELEREPVKLHTLESPEDENNKTPVKAQQHLTDSMKKSEKKRLSTKSSGKIPKKICHRTSKDVCSNSEDTESQTDSDSSSVEDVASKNQKLPDVKIKNSMRKHNKPRGPQDRFAAEKALSHESGPVLEHYDKRALRRKLCEQDNTSSDNSEDLSYQVKELLDNIARHKIGELVISGIECPEKESHRMVKQRRDGRQQKRLETRNEVPANLDHSIVDTSKLTVVLDPLTNEEILLECINTESNHTCFFKDDTVEIYKNLNTPAFAVGRLVLKPLKEKGHQFVHMDTIAFHVIYGKIIVTLHKTSYLLTTGHYFYVPAGNIYNIRNLLNEESVLLFTQLKKDT
ncbi:PREDICTED: centromere protein C isoform X3 [Calidris pugnax]|uniref:centromere protein C isoform X3 n=1 Tax=Calidris pugnax TaxID=198806 RepID=UPI00071D09E5|nr:PREDICTED: centromere protein C isoform X3 [Calidris pugnax]